MSIGNHTMLIPRKAQRGSLVCSILAGVAITSSIQISALYKLKKKKASKLSFDDKDAKTNYMVFNF